MVSTWMSTRYTLRLNTSVLEVESGVYRAPVDPSHPPSAPLISNAKAAVKISVFRLGKGNNPKCQFGREEGGEVYPSKSSQ